MCGQLCRIIESSLIHTEYTIIRAFYLTQRPPLSNVQHLISGVPEILNVYSYLIPFKIYLDAKFLTGFQVAIYGCI